MSQQNRVREIQMVGYSAGNFGKYLVLGGIDITLLFMLTDLLAIKAAAVARVMAFIFLGDLLFDIGAAYVVAWADRRGVGYRKIIACGAVPCCLGFATFYALPLLQVHDLAPVVAALLAFRAAYAIIDVPHNALLARVARDSRARGRTSGYRILFSTLASLSIAGLLAPAILAAASRGQTLFLFLIGIIGAVFACAALWISAWSSRPGGFDPAFDGKGRVPILPKLDASLGKMLGLAVITGFAIPMFGRMAIYIATYVYDRPDMAPRFLLTLTLGQFPGALLWTYLVRFAQKTTLLFASYLVLVISALLMVFGAADVDTFLILIALLGIGLAGVYMFPWGILADVIDFAELRHGDRREAATVAVFLVTIKASAATSAGTIGWSLGRLGYVAGAAQPAIVVTGMKAMAFGVPVAGALVAMLLLSRMAISDSAHAETLRLIRDRRSHSAREDVPPLSSRRVARMT